LQSQISAIQNHVEPGKAATRTDAQPINDLSTDPFPNQSLLDVLPDTHSQIFSLYQRSMGPSSVDPIPPVCFPDNIIRLARLLCDVYATGDLDDVVLQANVLGIPVDSRQSTPSMYPPRGEIARWAMRAWGPHLTHDSMPMSHRIRIIAALVHIMGTIGFRRKRATLLNEMLHLFIPQLVQARVIGASESGLHPHAAQSFVHQTTDDDGLVSLMDSLIKVYGVSVPLDDRQTLGWPSLRTHILRECIAFCDALPHPAGIAHFTSLLFTVASDGVGKDEQIRLAGNLARITGESKKRGKTVEADYWDMFVVQNIEILKYFACLSILTDSVEQRRASFTSQQPKTVLGGKEMATVLFSIVPGQRKISPKRRSVHVFMYN
jgi:trafficking protein particle complex subunit 9